MSEVTEMSRTQLWKRARDIMKTHSIMDGSGHLYLKNRGEKVSEEQTQNVIAFVHSELAQQGISEEKAKTINSLIKQTLQDITRRGPDVQKPPKSPKPAKPKPQLTVKKGNARQEVRQVVIQVTVKKARNFHYPRDLPSGGDL